MSILTPLPQPPAGLGHAGTGPDRAALRRHQISHDIRHELGTIMLLASLLSCASDVGPDSQDRARQLLGEARWLDELHRAYEDAVAERDAPGCPAPSPIRADVVAAEVIEAMRLSTLTRIGFTAVETWAHADRLAYWRALRNVVGNAVRAAGPGGHVDVRVADEDGWAVVQIDDDGPGFGSGPPGLGRLGLGIVQDMVAAWGGQLEIRRGVLGGCCVRLKLTTSVPRDPYPPCAS